MSFLKTLSKKLTPELLQEIQDALGDDFDYDVVPRSRLNAVIKQRNELREQLASSTQLDDDDDDEDDDPDDTSNSGGSKAKTKPGTKLEGVTSKQMRKLLADKDKEKEDAINALKIEHAAHGKLRDAKARDVDMVFGLLDKSKIKFDDKGELTGLDDQIAELTKNKAFLFNTEDVPGGTGKSGKSDSGGKDTLDDKIADVFADFGVFTSDEGDE